MELAAYQGGVCAVCGNSPNMSKKRGGLHVDHDHSTGKVRGLLCESCNVGLGFFKDSSIKLAKAIEYLLSPPANKVCFSEEIAKPCFTCGPRSQEKDAIIELTCKQCSKIFHRKTRDEYACRVRGKEGPFCSQTCSGTWARSQQLVVGLIHGTTTGYTAYKCRCLACKKAHAKAEKDRIRKISTS